ncbi:hypothetical protein DPMN_176100 [Dreissena polymorpha]|uniref:Uncharacterized protein n=1 Tax=Dreissena polymorpha TaxID=45954 RepID=A0A9D4IIV3_DREPO|nr:hypothetical protein DPMN_176100 [Dreissena polymorpha]
MTARTRKKYKKQLKSLSQKGKLSKGETFYVDSLDSTSSTDCPSLSSQASKLSKEIALLMQLLITKGSNDFVVNTRSRIQPSGVPQAQILPNIGNNVLKVKLLGFIASTSHSKSKQPRIESTLE